MPRLVLNLLSLLALMLCAATLVMWARGHFIVDDLRLSSGRRGPGGTTFTDWRLIGGGGFLAFLWTRHDAPVTGPAVAYGPDFSRRTSSPEELHFNLARNTFWQRAGFNWVNDSDRDPHFAAYSHRWVEFRAPYWSIAALTALPPALLLTARRRVRRQRARMNRCPSCGYNLTGNTSGACPECGASIPTPPPFSRGLKSRAPSHPRIGRKKRDGSNIQNRPCNCFPSRRSPGT